MWLAQYNQVACLLSQAGSSCNISPVTYWVASMSPEAQRDILAERPDVEETWDIEYGDRHTQFVIIGTNLVPDELIQQLDDCLLKQDEIDQAWDALPEPYGWQLAPAQ